MPIFQKDADAMEPGINSLADLLLGNRTKMAQQQNQANVDVGKARQMVPIEVDKAQQMVPIEGQTAQAKQAGQNTANMTTYKDFAPNAPDGASVKVGDLSVGVDPALKFAQQQKGTSDKAIKDASDMYNKGLPKINDTFNAASEGLQFTNDPHNIGSLGQARTLALKAMGMNRYNTEEAKAVVPAALQGTISSFFNSAGGDDTPLNESQKRSLNTFFKSMAEQAHQKHEMLKQNTLGSYKLRNGYDPNKEEGLKSGVMHNFDQTYDDRMKGFADLPSTTSDPAQRPAPTGTVDKLRALITGGGSAPAAAPAAPAQPSGWSAEKQKRMEELRAKAGK